MEDLLRGPYPQDESERELCERRGIRPNAHLAVGLLHAEFSAKDGLADYRAASQALTEPIERLLDRREIGRQWKCGATRL